MQRALQVDKLIVRDLSALAERGERGVLFHNFEDAGIHAAFVFFDENLVPAFADRDVAVGRDEVRQVDLQEGAGAVAAVLHLRREVADDLRELRRRGGRKVSGESECGAGRGADALCDVGQQAHVFRNRLEQLRRRRGLEDLKLQPLHFVGEGFGGHIDIGGESEKRRNVETEKVEFCRRDERPEVVFPRRGDLQPHLLHREGIARDAGHHGAKVRDRLAKGLGGVVGKVTFEDLESRVEQRHEHRHVDGRLVVGLLVEVVLPEVDDLELGLLPVRQTVQIFAGLLVARAAPDHLPELDA